MEFVTSGPGTVLTAALSAVLHDGRRYKREPPSDGDSLSGGAEGTRTPDPLHAMQVRYQLRHSPEFPADESTSRKRPDHLQTTIAVRANRHADRESRYPTRARDNPAPWIRAEKNPPKSSIPADYPVELGTRTPDPLHAIPSTLQLRHSPEFSLLPARLLTCKVPGSLSGSLRSNSNISTSPLENSKQFNFFFFFFFFFLKKKIFLYLVQVPMLDVIGKGCASSTNESGQSRFISSSFRADGQGFSTNTSNRSKLFGESATAWPPRNRRRSSAFQVE